MFSPQPIGYVRSRYHDTHEIPKGLGARHDTEGILEILPEFEAGLADIEGFSHLIVLWWFDRVEGFGINQILKGWAKDGLSDEDILERGFWCLDGLRAQLKRS